MVLVGTDVMFYVAVWWYDILRCFYLIYILSYVVALYWHTYGVSVPSGRGEVFRMVSM